MIKEFKKFIARGNVLDLAVGVIIGSAFSGIVTSLVNNIFTPIIGIIFGRLKMMVPNGPLLREILLQNIL